MIAILLGLAGLAQGAGPPPCPPGNICAGHLTPAQMFEAATNLERARRPADAQALLAALTHDPDPEIRAESRFRLGQLRERMGERSGAIASYRALLDEKPDAQRVRLELARLLAQTGDETGARRELRRASAAGLPEEVARVVDQLSLALRSRRPVGGSIELALAPDSNINRSTRQRTVDTVIAPFELSPDARGQSAVGASVTAQVYARGPVLGIPMLARLSGRGDLYGKSRFNDITLWAAAGPEISGKIGRWRPAFQLSRRWYGGDRYSDGVGGTLNWLRSLGRNQFEMEATISRMRYPALSYQNGWLYDLSFALEHAFTPRLSSRAYAGVTRQTARDEAFASLDFRSGLVLARQFGRQTVFGQLDLATLRMDERQPLFPRRRRDERLDATGGILLRAWRFSGLSPLLRVVHTENWSTISIYQFRRTRVEFALSRDF